MEVTQVQVFPVQEARLRAYATIVLDDALVLRNLRVIRGGKRLFVAMPSHRTRDGYYRDLAHPIRQELRQKIERTVLEAYARSASPESL